ncbi:helix-turn-helix transcriptional regulator [Nocardiopsis lambiniae]|uniref:AAA family ATPase n=1 Tax=Nocardiopsis lambiniae TaxID=3075539 RepID=A0ABU2MCA3_9ACTN|nr:AAA family ATPase [Nocardiopsis sp. DSM 44743]MDT0330304.1 AAA family ATPase [Nocardiopsis sp. DSM 44743]
MCSSPLVGRERERRRLRAATAPGTLTLLAGAAGTGKTRLVRELHDLPGPTVLTGHCPPGAEPFPFAPLIEALRRITVPGGLNPLCGALRTLLPEHADHLPPAPEPAADPAAEHHRLYRALTELLDALDPTVLVLEDVHWADPATRDLLAYLTPRLPAHLALVLTYRPEDLPRSFPVAALAARTPPGVRHHELTLTPLTRHDLRVLAGRTLTGTDVTADDARRLHTWTGGLPLAAVETLRALAEHPGPGTAIPERPPVPPSLRDWILDRLRALDGDARRLVRAACVLGEPATEPLLAHVAELTPARADKALSRACRHGLLTPAGPAALTAATPLLAHVCNTALPHGKRRRLHRVALAALSRLPEPPHPRLAHHAREAGLLDEWTDHAERAADIALRQGEDCAAVALLRDALTRPDLATRRRRDLALKLGRAAVSGISVEQTIDQLRDVLATPGLPATERGELRMGLGLLLLNQAARNRTARGELVRAAAELADRPDLAARAMCALAVPRSTPDSVDTHRRWMEQALAAAGRSHDTTVAHSVVVNHATLLAQIGDPAAWKVDLPAPGASFDPPTPDALARRREFARGSLNLADAAVMLGHYDRADRHLDDAATWSGADDAPYVHESVRALRLTLDWARGHWRGLAEETEHRLDSPRLAHFPSVTAELDILRAALALAQGEPALARTHLARVHPCRDRPDDPPRPDHTVPVRAFAAGLMARLALARGEPARAWEHVEDLVSLIAAKGIWVWAADLVPGMEALLACGREAIARDLCVRLRTGLRGTDAPAAATALIRLEAALAHRDDQHDRALLLYAEAEAGYRAMPRPYDAAQLREAAAHVHFARPRDEGVEVGLTSLHTALKEYTELGASWDAARVRRLLRAHGVITGCATVTRPHRDGRLSPREGEIAALAGQGRTNREIAVLLHLSPRTVETHVANALSKLGLRSRRDLAAPAPDGDPSPAPGP